MWPDDWGWGYRNTSWTPSYNPFAKTTYPKRATKLKARAQRRKMKRHQRKRR